MKLPSTPTLRRLAISSASSELEVEPVKQTKPDLNEGSLPYPADRVELMATIGKCVYMCLLASMYCHLGITLKGFTWKKIHK